MIIECRVCGMDTRKLNEKFFKALEDRIDPIPVYSKDRFGRVDVTKAVGVVIGGEEKGGASIMKVQLSAEWGARLSVVQPMPKFSIRVCYDDRNNSILYGELSAAEKEEKA